MVASSSSSGQPAVKHVGALTVRRTSDTSAELTRVIDAPRHLVFEAMSQPEHLPHWWGPRRHTMTSCDMDFRPGGSWRFVLRDDSGNEFGFRGEYREIVPAERVVQTFEFEGMPGAISVESMTLEEHGGKTTVRVTSTLDSREALEAFLQSGMEEGAAETYDRLEEYVRTLQ